MEQWRAVDAHNGGLAAQNRVVEGLVAAYSHLYDEEQNPDRDQSEKSGPDLNQLDLDPQNCPLPSQLPTADEQPEPDNLE